MQEFGTFMFHMVVHWHKLGEVENECTLHDFIVLAIFVPKIIKFSRTFDKVVGKTILTVFFWDSVIMPISALILICSMNFNYVTMFLKYFLLVVFKSCINGQRCVFVWPCKMSDAVELFCFIWIFPIQWLWCCSEGQIFYYDYDYY